MKNQFSARFPCAFINMKVRQIVQSVPKSHEKKGFLTATKLGTTNKLLQQPNVQLKRSKHFVAVKSLFFCPIEFVVQRKPFYTVIF